MTTINKIEQPTLPVRKIYEDSVVEADEYKSLLANAPRALQLVNPNGTGQTIDVDVYVALTPDALADASTGKIIDATKGMLLDSHSVAEGTGLVIPIDVPYNFLSAVVSTSGIIIYVQEGGF